MLRHDCSLHLIFRSYHLHRFFLLINNYINSNLQLAKLPAAAHSKASLEEGDHADLTNKYR